MVQRVAAEISIPFTVGGGINELADVERLLNAGADKVSVNSAALRNPGLINEITGHFGSQVCVVAIDAKETEEGWFCYLNGGRIRTERGLFEWAREVCDRGAGEILFTSMDHDGVKNGLRQPSSFTSRRGAEHSGYRFGRSRKQRAFPGHFHRRKKRCRIGCQRLSFWRDFHPGTENVAKVGRY